MRTAILLILLVGCANPPLQESPGPELPPEPAGGRTAMEWLPDAASKAAESLTNPQLIMVIGREGVDDFWGINDATKDGRAHRWSYYFAGDEGNIAVHRGDNISIETENIRFSENQTALTKWRVDSPTAFTGAKQSGLVFDDNLTTMILLQERELVWEVTSNFDWRIVHGETAEVREQIGDWGFTMEIGPGQSGTAAVVRSSMQVGFTFDVDIVAPDLVLNFTTGIELYTDFTVTIDMPRGRDARETFTFDPLEAHSMAISYPLPGTYYVNVTSTAEHPAMDIAWCALGFDGTDTPVWCD